MTQENKDLLMRLLQQYKELGISDQIDFDKFYLNSIISNSVSLVDDNYGTVIDQSELDNLTIEPSIAEKMVDIMEFVADKDEITTETIVAHAKRYLRQLTEFGYLEAHGGNSSYIPKKQS